LETGYIISVASATKSNFQHILVFPSKIHATHESHCHSGLAKPDFKYVHVAPKMESKMETILLVSLEHWKYEAGLKLMFQQHIHQRFVDQQSIATKNLWQWKWAMSRGVVLKKEVGGRHKKLVDARRLQGHKCT